MDHQERPRRGHHAVAGDGDIAGGTGGKAVDMTGHLAGIFANGLGDGTPAEHVAAGAIDADTDWAFHARELLGEANGTHAAPPLCLFFRPGNEVIQIEDRKSTRLNYRHSCAYPLQT